MKIAAKMTDSNENSTKFCKNHEKIAKINGAKDCKFEFGAVQRNANLVDTFGFVFFSLQGLPEGSRLPTDPKMPFPYWKIDYFMKDMPSIYNVHLRIQQNQRKSGRDG